MAACELCGGAGWQTLEEVGATRVVRCACGLVFVTPPPPRPALEGAYDRTYYAAWEDQARQRERIWRQRMERVGALTASPGTLLDVGCGTGTFLRLARSRGWEVAGTEFSSYAARAAAGEGMRVAAGEVWEAGFPAGVFDVVTCWHVLEHTSRPRRVLEEIRRVLRPGGWLVLATPNLDDHLFQAAYLLARRRRPRLYEPDGREVHLFHFSPETLQRLVASVGFEVLDVGFDRGAAAVWGKRVVSVVASLWFRLTGINWGMGLELTARKPSAAARGA